MTVPAYDVVVALSYYAPYVSGLTETARMIAEGSAQRGLRVVVVTPRYDRALPARERLRGVDVVRTRVVAHVSKGAVSPTFPFVVARYARRARVLHMHLPLIESGVISALVPRRVPVVCDYHCDVELASGLLNRAIVGTLNISNRLAIRRARRVVVSTDDFARASRLRRSLAGRTVAVLPPVNPRVGGRPWFRDGAGPHIGFLGRIVAEKGIVHLVSAFRRLANPDARLLIGGDYERVAGGSVVDQVRAAASADPRIHLLGFVADDQLADFFASLDLFVLPSVNSLETFGVAQVEAMIAGVPVVASDLPGVRQPVRETGFGAVVAPGDVAGLRDAMAALVAHGPWDPAVLERARDLCSVERALSGYAGVYASVGVAPGA